MLKIYDNYRDYNYINALIFNNLYKLPENIDVVVGIPRSGMITATIISEFRSLPLTDIFTFINSNLVKNSFINANGSHSKIFNPDSVKHILLVDDACGFGITMKNSVDLIRKNNKDVKITTFATFVEPYSTDKIDIYCEVMKYQFMPYSILKRGIEYACVDMDGVLTEEVPPQYDTDNEKYENFLYHQRSMYIPETPIGVIVTGRLLKYKDVTIDWLKRHNIKYNDLIMLDLQDKKHRDNINVGKFKSSVYCQYPEIQLFIESNLHEAMTIKQFSNKSVFCTQICNMI